ncbi:MAG TPA: DsrE family protein [Spirochaetia bacterium]|nr:DsrE family protein [Spirochaetia bacterium]
MAKFLFVLSRGLEDPTRATRAFHLAKVARDKGHTVDIFLVDDGVVYAELGFAENVKAPTGDGVKPYLDFLVEKEVPFYVCTPCARARNLDEENFIPGARLATADRLIELAAEASVFTF